MLDRSFDEVLASAQGGDEVSFERLWRHVNASLVRYLRVLAPSIAEDVASEVWLQVVRGLPEFRGGEPQFMAWLFTIARNRVTDWFRQQGRRPTDPLDESVAARVPAGVDTAELALERISTEAALALLAWLPREQAEAIVLRVVAGLDAGTVGGIMGKSPGAVRVAAHRGLRQLAAILPQGRTGEPVRGGGSATRLLLVTFHLSATTGRRCTRTSGKPEESNAGSNAIVDYCT